MFSRQDLPDRPTKAHRPATRLWQRIGAVHHQSALRALLFAVPVALSPVLAPVQASAQSLTLCPGDVVVPQGTPCPTPTTAPLLTISSCTGASVIIQRCALDASSGPGFGQTLQNQAVAQLLNAYQLPPTDGARILDSERSLVRGVMFNTLLQMVTKTHATAPLPNRRPWKT